ncbi:MAG: bifunctional chorismate mutase/prephenate dehydrogenase [Wenzhouxiangellaceae bacterium]|nr:bifunctional chorismate mutase/prephenate dehydrogenase [Wenzhouxiangellaceae bacterium]
MTDPNELMRLRTELDRIDRELVERAAARQRTVSRIGEIKHGSGRQLRDFAREREVLDGVRSHARECRLDPDVAEQLMTTLIEASLTRQERERVRLTGAGSGRRALVVGGKGRMGGWMVRFLASQGYEVRIADPAVEADGNGHVTDWRRAGFEVELIVVAAPIAASRDVVAGLAERGTAALVLDVASIKDPLVGPLRDAAARGLRICSIHPMFGPGTVLLAGRNVLFMDCGHAGAVDDARALFADTMAACLDVPLEQHDRVAAWVLGLSHLVNVAFAASLAKSGHEAGTLAALSSTTFLRQLDVAAGVAAENPSLYFEIQRLNPHQSEAATRFAETLEALRSAVADGDAEGFAELMRAGREWSHAVRRAGDSAHDEG